jgi:hypothetical protein
LSTTGTSFAKRQRERARQEKKREKARKREERKGEKDRPEEVPAGVDPDIADIVPGPQPLPPEMQD